MSKIKNKDEVKITIIKSINPNYIQVANTIIEESQLKLAPIYIIKDTAD